LPEQGEASGAERLLEQELTRRGLIFQRQIRPAPLRRGRADFVFEDERVAVYVNGCFWHGCPHHAGYVGRSSGYWLERHVEAHARDQTQDDVLAAAGWTPVRVWEHENPTLAAGRIERLVGEGRESS
jgi:DNA mismatch endonuclease (patch repair protein)